MSDSVQDCIDRLRDLAQTSTSDYRIVAGQIVSDFNAHASDADREKLKRRLVLLSQKVARFSVSG